MIEEELNNKVLDNLMEAIQQGDSYKLNKILESEDYHKADINLFTEKNNPLLESYINIDRSCFNVFRNFYPDCINWTFNNKNYIDISLIHNLQYDIYEELEKNTHFLTEDRLILLIKESPVYFIKDVLDKYKYELNITQNFYYYSLDVLLNEIITNTEYNKEKKNIIESILKNSNLEINKINLFYDIINSNNLSYFINNNYRKNIDKCIEKTINENLSELLLSILKEKKANHIFSSSINLKKIFYLLDREEFLKAMKLYIENMIVKKYSAEVVMEALQVMCELNVLFKKEGYLDLIYGSKGFLLDEYKKSENIEKDFYNKTLLKKINCKIESVLLSNTFENDNKKINIKRI